MELRDALKKLREELNMKQSDLAEALSFSAVTINRWENGKNLPGRSAGMRILQFARDQEVSTVCLASLQEALFPDCISL